MSNTNSDYTGEYVLLYDIITGHKDYKAESKRLLEIIKKHRKLVRGGASLLSIGCGTGSHEIYLDEDGCSVVGIDISDSMIQVAHTKPFQRSVFNASSIHMYSQLNHQNFDVAISLFNVVNCLDNIDSLVKFFKSTAYALKPKGLFFFEAWNMIPCIISPPEVVTRKFIDPEGGYDLERSAVPTFNSTKQALVIDYTINGGYAGKEVNLKSTHSLTLFSHIEFEYALKTAGFNNISFGPSLADMQNGISSFEEVRMMSVIAHNSDS